MELTRYCLALDLKDDALFNGQPQFETLKPYMLKELDLKQLGQFMGSQRKDHLLEWKDRGAGLRLLVS